MILLFGPPGAGKSVQGQLLAASKRWRWLSIGQVLRDLNDPKLLAKMQTGELVDDEEVHRALNAKIKDSAIEHKLILDGFPRTPDQARWLVEHLPKHGRAIKAAVVLQVPYEEVMDRLHLRGRRDDTDEIITKRTEQYYAEFPPIVDYLRSQNVPVLEIDGVGDVKLIHKAIMKELENVDTA